jgi:hypothetical protein
LQSIKKLEPAPEPEIRTIVEEEEEQPEVVEEPEFVQEDYTEEVVEESNAPIVEETIVEEEEKPVKSTQADNSYSSAFDYLGNYEDDEEIVGTLD